MKFLAYQKVAARLAAWRGFALSLSGVILPMVALGCSNVAMGLNRDRSQPECQRCAVAGAMGNPTANGERGTGPIELAVYHDGNHPAPNSAVVLSEQSVGPARKEPAEPTKRDNSSPARLKITLPMAIAMCVNQNFQVLAAAERVQQAEADFTTSSLIPNPSLFADCQLIPLQHADIRNQLGPPQWDALVTFPIDWLLFGKRLAAMRAARLGIEVSDSDAANALRVQLVQTVDAFYEVLMDEAYFKLSVKTLDELQALEKLTQEIAKAGKAGALELDRVKLAVHEALLERHDRELALEVAKARLRPFLGRSATEGDYEIEGDLDVSAVVPPPKLKEALVLAEIHRPDLAADLKAIDQAHALVESERRKAKPQVALQPGWSFQDQRHIDGFRNGSMLDVGISTTLPLTDRNQGNIRKARAQARERQLTYQGHRAEVLAEVEAGVATYGDAVEHLTEFNTPETLQAARNLWQNMRKAYRGGDRKLIEVLDAHKAYRDRFGHVIEFRSDYWRALNKLNAAVGLKAYDPERFPTQPAAKTSP